MVRSSSSKSVASKTAASKSGTPDDSPAASSGLVTLNRDELERLIGVAVESALSQRFDEILSLQSPTSRPTPLSSSSQPSSSRQSPTGHYQSKTVKDLRAIAVSRGISLKGATTKDAIIARIIADEQKTVTVEQKLIGIESSLTEHTSKEPKAKMLSKSKTTSPSVTPKSSKSKSSDAPSGPSGDVSFVSEHVDEHKPSSDDEGETVAVDSQQQTFISKFRAAINGMHGNRGSDSSSDDDII